VLRVPHTIIKPIEVRRAATALKLHLPCLLLALAWMEVALGSPVACQTSWSLLTIAATLATVVLTRVRLWDVVSSPFLVLTLSYTMYFGLGGLVLLSPEESGRIGDFIHDPDLRTADIAKVAAINSVGYCATCIGCIAAPRKAMATAAAKAVNWLPEQRRDVTALILLILAYAILLPQEVLPTMFGVSKPEGIGFIAKLGPSLGYGGIVLGASFPWSRRPSLVAASLALSVVLAISGLLALSKSQALAPLICLGLGRVLTTGSTKHAMAWLVCLSLATVALINPILRARDLAVASHSTAGAWQMFFEKAGPSEPAEGTLSAALGRFCYVPTQVATVRLYDGGQPGMSLYEAGWLMAPRLLFPSKPELSRHGALLHETITGNPGSSDAPGIYVDGHYQFGWKGSFAAGLLVGMGLGLMGAAAVVILAAECWLLMPIALYASYQAFRVDGILLIDSVAPTLYCASLILLLALAGSVGIRMQRLARAI
jgi:hypothetical protein